MVLERLMEENYNDLISIIIPVYNVEKYLRKCIDSVLEQTYKNIEVILVDDGSTDNCGKICDEYLLKDGRIKVIHKENGGLSDARNKGIDASNGKYIMFVDSDDYVDKDMIKLLYNSLINSGADMSICRFVHVDEAGNVTNDFNESLPCENMILTSEHALRWFAVEYLPFFVISCCKLYKRFLWDRIRFPKGKINEDEFVSHEIFGECETITFVNRSLYYYLQRSGSIMSSTIDGRQLDAVEAFFNRAAYYFNKKINFEATKIFYQSVYAFNSRLNKIQLDSIIIGHVKELMRKCRKIYIKNFRLIFKNLSRRSFIYISLGIIDFRLLNLALRIFRKK